MTQDNLAFASAWELRRLISRKKVSPVEVTQLLLQRIEALNPRLNAYLTITADGALAQAKAAEAAAMRGESLGPLHGIPVSIKDLEVTRGIRTTLGSLAFQDTVPTEDSIVVERVREAGAIILGKTNTPEFGVSGTTENRLGNACRNPWDPTRTAGGSSGGAAAAVAAGLCTLALGSDGGGSIRIPASFCGVYGIKPTQGRVPRYGRLGREASSQTSQPGPLARTVRDAAMLLQVLAGPDRRDPTCLWEKPPDFLRGLNRGVRGLRIVWSRDLGYAAVDPEVVEVASRVARVFEELGCVVEEPGVSMEDPSFAFRVVFSVNAYAAYGHLLEERADLLTDYAILVLEFGREVAGWQYSQALHIADVLRAQMAELLDRYDLLLTPTLAVTPFPVGERPRSIAGREVDPSMGFFPFTFPFNMTGQPAASVPCGFSREGLPIGLHIIGRWGDEATVLRASAAFEEVRPWGQHYPPPAARPG